MSDHIGKVRVSGQLTTRFRGGIALAAGDEIAHHFDRSELGEAISRCGRKRVKAGQLFEAGDIPVCRACERAKGTP